MDYRITLSMATCCFGDKFVRPRPLTGKLWDAFFVAMADWHLASVYREMWGLLLRFFVGNCCRILVKIDV